VAVLLVSADFLASAFIVENELPYYVQFWREEDSILTEAVSNAFLPEKLRLGESKIDKLQGLGLTPPSKDLENFSRIDGTSDPTRLLPRLARSVADVMADVYEVSRDAKLDFDLTLIHAAVSFASFFLTLPVG
jgi:hypothetical protein